MKGRDVRFVVLICGGTSSAHGHMGMYYMVGASATITLRNRAFPWTREQRANLSETVSMQWQRLLIRNILAPRMIDNFNR
jgi:hypothetical protein